MSLLVRHLGEVEYQETWQKMRDFTDTRDKNTPDELWFLQHPSVFTLGKNGKPEHVLDSAEIPVINCDRGGQVTYHGPGQIVVYTLLDLTRMNIGVRALVTSLEQTIVELLGDYGIDGKARPEAPGVYVNNAKIAALGLRIRKGRSFHGLALNVDMDLEPFRRINPCGYEGLEVTQLKNLVSDIEMASVTDELQQRLINKFSYE